MNTLTLYAAAFVPLVVILLVSVYGICIRDDKEIVSMIDSPALFLTELNKSRGILALIVLINHILWINDIKMRLVASVWGPLTFTTVFLFMFLSGMGMEQKCFSKKSIFFKMLLGKYYL